MVVFLNTYGPVILMGASVIYLLWKRDYKLAVGLILGGLITSFFAVFIKELYLVPRPFRLGSNLPKAGLYHYSSFPSSHTALSFFISTYLFFYKKRLGYTLFAGSFLVALGRVWANVHTPLDVVMGALVGILVGGIIKSLTDST